MLRQLEKKFKKMTFYEQEEQEEPEEQEEEPKPLEEIIFRDFKTDSRGMFYLEW
jgi:hypothetical protein